MTNETRATCDVCGAALVGQRQPYTTTTCSDCASSQTNCGEEEKMDIVRSLNVGESVSLDINGQGGWIKRVQPNVYSLYSVAAAPYRSRWGTATEISEDLEHFLTYGTLPGPSGVRW